MNFKVETRFFNQLSINELYQLLQLRSEVFVVEQNCVYQDMDGKDLDAYHVLVKDEQNKIVGTARILNKGVSYEELAIGRVVSSPKFRGQSIGKLVMLEAIRFIYETFGQEAIRISAQAYLLKFYSDLGFKETGKSYLEDGIPHNEMLKQYENE